ncbi:helix-turn-helix transcriptional regulator [Cytophagaceae bacterium DM2B3-1]|uniref:Helix-turn-helix transcriptional regulator n=2 Tax=Xanthocytophaga TaxID=3078918 RepID=A0ABT7CDL7_9BACT|nr:MULTISPECIES: helix-turn-helix transcriptional regulator [Xanthocytophaga]MDJ1491824.1 helix-turn-helix transcriptional regulator [Xanthocytophaga flavus]MDJ1502779.1 helix-turn-helix transcriptional regulator [Xanthocytophaga agilis]
MDLQNIGTRIYHLRTEILQLSQRDFSHLLGMGQGNISKVEKGQSLPSCFFLWSLYNTYQINVNWVLSGEGEVKVSEG